MMNQKVSSENIIANQSFPISVQHFFPVFESDQMSYVVTYLDDSMKQSQIRKCCIQHPPRDTMYLKSTTTGVGCRMARMLTILAVFSRG